MTDTEATDTPTLDTVRGKFAPYVDVKAVQGLQASHEQQLAAIDNDGKLTDDGKKAAQAALYEETTAAMNQYRAAFETEVDKATITAEKRLFGPASTDPATLMAHRDALERADNIANEKAALDAIARARYSGDDSMVRAITMRAETQGWETVLGQVEKAAPGTASKLEAYRRIPGGDQTTTNQVFAVKVPQRFLSKTGGGVNSYELRMWARK
jgi:hypothetical protein